MRWKWRRIVIGWPSEERAEFLPELFAVRAADQLCVDREGDSWVEMPDLDWT